MARRIAVYLFALVQGLSVCSASWAKCKPEEVIKAYCRLDALGTRLRWMDCNATDSLVLWDGEPGWDQSMIIDGYDLLQSHRSGDTLIVGVRYRQVGWWSGGELLPAPGIRDGNIKHAETVNFKLIRRHNCWKILGPIIMPHVSLDSTISHFGQWLQRTEERVNSDTINASVAKYIRDMRRTYDALVLYRESKKH